MDGALLLIIAAIVVGAVFKKTRTQRALGPPAGVKVLMPPKRDPLDAAMFSLGLKREPNPETAKPEVQRVYHGLVDDHPVRAEVALDKMMLFTRIGPVDDSSFLHTSSSPAAEVAIVTSRLSADLLDALDQGASFLQQDGELGLILSGSRAPPKAWLFALVESARRKGDVAHRLCNVAIADERADLRRSALHILHAIAPRSDALKAAIVKALADCDFSVRADAARLVNRDAQELARQLAVNRTATLSIRCQAAVFLGTTKLERQNVQLLTQLYESDDPDGTMIAIEAIDAFTAQTDPDNADRFLEWLIPSAQPTLDALLLRFLKSGRDDLVLGATAALGAHGSPAVLSALESLRGERSLIQAAQRAIEQIRIRHGKDGALSISREDSQGALGVVTEANGALSETTRRKT